MQAPKVPYGGSDARSRMVAGETRVRKGPVGNTIPWVRDPVGSQGSADGFGGGRSAKPYTNPSLSIRTVSLTRQVCPHPYPPPATTPRDRLADSLRCALERGWEEEGGACWAIRRLGRTAFGRCAAEAHQPESHRNWLPLPSASTGPGRCAGSGTESEASAPRIHTHMHTHSLTGRPFRFSNLAVCPSVYFLQPINVPNLHVPYHRPLSYAATAPFPMQPLDVPHRPRPLGRDAAKTAARPTKKDIRKLSRVRCAARSLPSSHQDLF